MVLSNDCPLAKEAGSKCCKGGSELSLDIINGQDGMEESSTNTVNDDYFDNPCIEVLTSLIMSDITSLSVIHVMVELTSIKLP